MKRLFLLFSGLLVVLLVAAGSVGAYYMTQRQPVSSRNQTKQRFVIPTGQAVTIIANRLQELGLIKNALVFRAELKRLGLEGKLQAGSFDISPSMTMGEVAKTLTTGTNDIWITLPEGWRREEIASYLTQKELPGFNESEFLDTTASLEGGLFPETYLVPRQVTTHSLINLFTRTFKQKIETGLAQEIAASKYDLDEVLVMASLVEREANTYDQMREVAGILWRRLDVGMPLQVDATLQYAKGYDTQNKTWWSTPFDVDRRRDNLYNTYLNAGLPPGPIANPSLNAIKATLTPNPTANVFYLHAPDGKVYTAKTLDEHNRNIQLYLR